MMKPWTIAVNAGRLVEGRPHSLRTKHDAIAYCAEYRLLVPPLRRAVICADYREISVFPPEVADELARLMGDMNPYVERSAILVAPEHATNALQVNRFVQETRNESRRRFTDTHQLARWLGEVLDSNERERLVQFLS